jgi:hypothetical protein
MAILKEEVLKLSMRTTKALIRHNVTDHEGQALLIEKVGNGNDVDRGIHTGQGHFYTTVQGSDGFAGYHNFVREIGIVALQ